ncbi:MULTISPECIES: hypothetical protein [Microcoleus]|uniref:hypothetical protein n=1 Tax=Microcoleus TaxID=44471 RepID=UPI0018EF8154
MTPQFRLTEPAIQDIEQIADYIARQSLFFSLKREKLRLYSSGFNRRVLLQ